VRLLTVVRPNHEKIHPGQSVRSPLRHPLMCAPFAFTAIDSRDIEMKKSILLKLAAVSLLALFLVSFLKASSAPPKKLVHVLKEDAKVETAIFAGGCFWCVEANFEKVDGVSEVVSGYTGGHTENPTYREVCGHQTGHLEAVKVTFDSNVVAYNDLLEVFWRTIDPTDAGGSFVDRGEPYTSAIFVANESQRQLAEASKQKLDDSKRFDTAAVTPIRDAVTFYDAVFGPRPVHCPSLG